MTRQAISEKLAELRQSDSGRSQTARLADLLPEIEATLASGVSRQAVLDQLNESGFNLTLKGFETALSRLRKRARTAGQPRPSSNLAASSVPAPAAPGPSAQAADSPPAAPEDLRGLDPKARREKRADHYLPDTPAGNPLLSKVKKDHQA